ncbi:unnamed protein product [Meloidogyne enterolobii]|uniref:BHLH domain-containing protein n=3 Tax=Meloidogyne TaxID=189290 RepID=A0A6V7VDW7_MELEN|nr:unnamed protein product [Meloidogyne enterolobii]CAD2183244.1 unnamed protein product [Meloidogyne enterolobii]
MKITDHRKLRRAHLKNIRERERVVYVNKAFLMLRACLPQMRGRKRRVSKLKLLRAAVEHIKSLEIILRN